jgi:SAF domain-containing protein
LRSAPGASGLLVYRVNEEHRTVPVLIAVQDIPANTQLYDLIHKGDFIVVSIPETQKLPAALSSLDELRGQSAAQDIHRYEQVIESELGVP